MAVSVIGVLVLEPGGTVLAFGIKNFKRVVMVLRTTRFYGTTISKF